VSVTATDTLDSIAGKINALGLRAGASVFYDGSTYRLQIRGLDTGAANALVFTETGTALDLNGTGATAAAGKTVQVAQNAAAPIDGFAVTSATNDIAGAIAGVTLTVSKVTTAPVSVTVDSDPDTMAGKVKGFVDAFNSVIQAVHSAAGFGSLKPQNPVLAGDSSLRAIASRLSSLVSSTFTGSTLTRLGEVGVTLAKDGTLSVDDAKLKTQVANDMISVEKLFGRAKGATTGGAMAAIRDLVKEMTDTGGTFLVRSESLEKEHKRLDDRATSERARLDRYAETLRKQFSAMETAYSQNQTLLSQVAKL
jgi:flagellar hook-associated protein 2